MSQKFNDENTKFLNPEDPFEIPIEDCLDLHSFRPSDIKALVLDYIKECYKRGYTDVRLIHGKGIGTQRSNVRKVLEKIEYVIDFHDASPERGHWGATIVHLKKKGKDN